MHSLSPRCKVSAQGRDAVQGGREQGRGGTQGCGEGSVWWAALACLRESHTAEGFAVSWCGREGCAGCPGVCTVAGSQLGGTLQELEEEGAQRCRFCPRWPTQKSPLPAELAKRARDLIYSDGPCIRKFIPLSLPSGLQLPSLGAGRRGTSGDAPYPAPCPPPGEAGQGAEGSRDGGGFSPASLSPLRRLPTASAKR